MTTRIPWIFLLAAGLLLAACSSGQGRGRARGATSARQAGRQTAPPAETTAPRTSDTGSRYLDVARPVGGITVETAPIAGGALFLPYAAHPTGTPPTAPRGTSPSVAGAGGPAPRPTGGALPAPAIPPRGRVPAPPPPPAWP